MYWPINGTLTDTTTPGQSGLESNSNEGVLHIPQSFRIGASPSNPGLLVVVVVVGGPHLDVVGIFYSSSRQDWKIEQPSKGWNRIQNTRSREDDYGTL